MVSPVGDKVIKFFEMFQFPFLISEMIETGRLQFSE
jgi:hypothetical protein